MEELRYYYSRSTFVDIGLASFVRGIVCWEGDHVRLVLIPKDSKGLTKALVGEVSSCLRKIGCRCVLDEQVRNECRTRPLMYSVLIGLRLFFLSSMLL